MYAFILSNQNLDMSLFELECILRTHNFPFNYDLYENIAVVSDLTEDIVRIISLRAGLVKRIEKVHLILDKYDEGMVSDHDWSFIDDSYAVKVINWSQTHSDKDPFNLVHKIYYSLESPVVDLKNPQIKINLIHNHEWYIFSQTVFKLNRSESKISNPYSIKDYLAKFMINVGLLDCKGPINHVRLFDPFCGTGKIVKYAQQFGLDTWGFEISSKNIAGSNELYPQIINHISMRDSLQLNDEDQGNVLITDPPYFRNTKGKQENYLLFYNTFFKRISQNVKSMVIIFPKSFEQSFIPDSFKLEKKFELFVHKTLTRVIYIYRR